MSPNRRGHNFIMLVYAGSVSPIFSLQLWITIWKHLSSMANSYKILYNFVQWKCYIVRQISTLYTINSDFFYPWTVKIISSTEFKLRCILLKFIVRCPILTEFKKSHAITNNFLPVTHVNERTTINTLFMVDWPHLGWK